MRILLIDDDKDDQDFFREALSQINTAVVLDTADNGIKGLELLSASVQLPDLVFLDVNMPVMNGRETLTLIRANRKFDNIRVIMYSTSNSAADIDWFKAFVVKYVVKPNSFDALVDLIEREIATCRIAELQ